MIPKYQRIETVGCATKYVDEPFVNLESYSNGKIIVDMHYFFNDYPGSTHIAYVRKTVADMLIKAAESLPSGMKLKVLDAWRSIETQKAIYNKLFEDITMSERYLTEAEAHVMTQKYVSFPNENCYLHGTGGSVDVTVVDKNGNDLHMGTAFDAFTYNAQTDYYENRLNLRIFFNRRILYKAMIDAGFVNNPEEWWHYSYGDAIWSAITDNPIKYRTIGHIQMLNIEEAL